MVRRLVETQRGEMVTTRTRQLDHETARNTNGDERWGDHDVDLDPGRTAGACEDHEGSDREGEGDHDEDEQERRLPRGQRDGKQNDRDERNG
jgi:hypothetical protein